MSHSWGSRQKSTCRQVDLSRIMGYLLVMVMEKQQKRKAGRPSNPVSKKRIVDIATTAFAEAGYAAASLSQIADQIGLRKASLYHHFPTKKSLYSAVIERILEDIRKLVIEAQLDKGDYIERFTRANSLTVEYLASQKDAARLLLFEVMGEGTYVRGDGGEQVQTTLSAIVYFLETGIEAGIYRQQDSKHLALTLAGIHLCYFAIARASSDLLGADVFTKEMIEQRKAAVIEQTRALCVKEEYANTLDAG